MNGALLAELGRTGTDLLLHAINVTAWLGFTFAYLRATGRCRPLAYLKLKDNVAKGLAIGILVGMAFVTKDLARVLLLEGRAPDLASLTPSSFLSPFVEEVTRHSGRGTGSLAAA